MGRILMKAMVKGTQVVYSMDSVLRWEECSMRWKESIILAHRVKFMVKEMEKRFYNKYWN